jgi:glycolate oxidase FAD binding subunit
VPDEFKRISMKMLRGIIEYEPSEFTFTAMAGTPLKVIAAELSQSGQYLPFDPLLADAERRWVNRRGGFERAGAFSLWRTARLHPRRPFRRRRRRLLRLGGRVVKNAAGFDVPKFFVGSAGRFWRAGGNVWCFPRPLASRTLRIEANDIATKARILTDAANTRWELDALDAALGRTPSSPDSGRPPAALDALTAEILPAGRAPCSPTATRVISGSRSSGCAGRTRTAR